MWRNNECRVEELNEEGIMKSAFTESGLSPEPLPELRCQHTESLFD